jgi:protein-S-isoprenylcysteine O-methyltransferase
MASRGLADEAGSHPHLVTVAIMIERVLWAVVLLFPASEIAMAFLKRSRRTTAQSQDQGSLRLLWLSIGAGTALAVMLQSVPSTRLPGPNSISQAVALILLAGGLAVRWSAILTLGSLFTVDVAIHADHAVVDAGPYRFIRHPSYTGLLFAVLGLGVFFGNWLSIILLMIPVTLAVLNRVAKEEEALRGFMGPAYDSYCKRTRRFIPGLL